MTCSSCRYENPVGSAFCEECGAPLERRCPSCGNPVGTTAKFCRGCGTSLVARAAEKAAEPEARKIVTIVFADLIGSTSLHERLDPESVSRVMDRYHRTVRAPIEAHGGTVVQLLGDGVMCAFGVPRVAEDDAIRAVRAAVGIQEAFREFAREESARVGSVGLRVAVNTGEVVVSGDYAAGIGDPLNVAARLQQEARDGDVLIGEATQRLVRELVTLAPVGKLSLKGRAETVAAFRVVSLERPAGASATPFVGREDELRRIMAVHDAAVAGRRARLAVILGSPGLGKSRLMDEIARRLGDGATVLTAQCDAAGGATFAPIARALRTHLHLDDAVAGDVLRAAIEASVPGDDAERGRIASGIAALIGGTPASPEETFFVVRRLLTALAAAQPVVLAIDDLQWAEPLLLDLTEHLIQWTTDVPLLVLVAARPELRDTRSSLAAPGNLVTDVVTLSGLDAGAAMRLAANVIGAGELPAAVAGRVLATSEGNPLFVGELVRMLVHDGALKREGERWTASAEVARLEMPPTIQALLAARIERLRPEERTVLERAAVVGRQFSRAAVTHLLPREIIDLDTRLEALRRSELIEPDTGWFLGEPVLRFHHVLIRDAAYRRVLKNTRAELHARFADWLESKVGDAVEHDETMGWHLEQAHQHLRELGPLDASGRALGERAAKYLAAAGRRALARDDLPLAGSLLGRALERLDAADAARADLVLDWCEALLAAGDVGTATKAVEELGRFVGDSERLRAWHTCFTGQLAALTDPQALHATASAVGTAAETLAAAGDAAGEAKAHWVQAIALGRLGKVGACEAALDRALAAARRAGDRRRSNGVLAGAPTAALWGPSPVTRASGRCLDVVRVLRITQGAPAVEAVALRCQGVLEALRGRTEAARRMIASSRRMVEELGITHRLLEADVFAGHIELLEGDAAAAERSLRAAYDGLREQGLAIDAAQAGALLGRALLALDRAADAEAVSYESEALAGDDLGAAIAWRGVRAEALARRGDHAGAIEFARAAVDLAAATDALLHHADARLALAAALRAAGRDRDAAAEEARAIELWEAKGATVLAERARQAGARVAREARVPEKRAEPVRAVRRVVRANAATARLPRFAPAIAANDLDALTSLFSDAFTAIDHGNHITYDRQGMLSGVIQGLRDSSYRVEALATLGDSLALTLDVASGSGVADGRFDIGAYETQHVYIDEVDGEGRTARMEVFPVTRLGDAVARLYERYAELLPDGPERTAAAATARSVARLFDPAIWEERAPDGRPDARDREEARLSLYAPEHEGVDHRSLGFPPRHGAKQQRDALRTWLDVASNVSASAGDVLDLRSNGLLVRCTVSGTVRASGGAFEQELLVLWTFGRDGRVTRSEAFDADREAEALARFAELMADTAAARPRASARRVRRNAAIANSLRIDAALASREVDEIAAILADDVEVVDHTTGTTFGREGMLATYRASLHAAGLELRTEPLASLGEALGLCRVGWAASGFAGATLDVGAYENGRITLAEVDEHGRRTRQEFFAEDKLGDAVRRLYERYAELLPEGPARFRASATACTVAELCGPTFHLAPSVYALEHEFIDHRPLGFPPRHGAKEHEEALHSMLDLADDVTNRIDDVLDVRANGLLVRWRNTGTLRASGGAYESPFLMFWVFGSDGRVTRNEVFPEDRDAEALARFAEVTAEPAAALPQRRDRRVRPNAATANITELSAAFAARDPEALRAVYADDPEVVDHTTGTALGLEGLLAMKRALSRAQDFTVSGEVLATLGDSLALQRSVLSAHAVTGTTWDVGPYESERTMVVEVDAHGRRTRHEFFAADKLGDAVSRLYERYAEVLPEGPARERAATMARSLAAILDLTDIARYEKALDPAIEFIDHRSLCLPSRYGLDQCMESVRSLVDTSGDLGVRLDDILRAELNGVLDRRTQFGTVRSSGGTYERLFLNLSLFGEDGRLIRHEFFDPDREDEALARFDELMAEPAAMPPKRRHRRARANAATASVDRIYAAMRARDAAALSALLADEAEVVDHATGVVFDREGQLANIRSLAPAGDLTHWSEVLATLGDSLALHRVGWSSSGLEDPPFDVGAYEQGRILLAEVDAQGRRTRTELFASDKLTEAVARLYARYAERLPDGPARVRAVATARTAAGMPEQFVTTVGNDFLALLDPAIEFVDHRPFGFPPTRGAREMQERLRGLLDLATDIVLSVDDILDLRPNGHLVCFTNRGIVRESGGAYERQFLMLWTYGPDGRLTRNELFAGDREAEALARFEALTAEAQGHARRIRRNAAAVNVDAVYTALATRSIDALPALLADGLEVVDHTTGASYDRAGALANYRSMHRGEDLRHESDVLATLGQSLALARLTYSSSGFTGATFDVGAYENEQFFVAEVDVEGRRTRTEHFARDRLGAGIARLYARYAELLPAGPARDQAAARAGVIGWLLSEDWTRAAARIEGHFSPLLDPAIEFIDHRPLGFPPTRGAKEYWERICSLLDLAAGVTDPIEDVVGLEPDGFLIRCTQRGTVRATGGAFERQFLMLWMFGRDGLIVRNELFDVGDLREALARFDELTAESRETPVVRRLRSNAATANVARFDAAIAARDLGSNQALYADDAEVVDHVNGAVLDRDAMLRSARSLLSARDLSFRSEPLATLGESLALCRLALSASGFSGGAFDVGAYENDQVFVAEVDAHGRRTRTEHFFRDRLGDAIILLYARYAELLPDGSEKRARATARARTIVRILDPPVGDSRAHVTTPGPNEGGFAPDVEFIDHRLFGFPPTRGAAASRERVRTLFDLAADVVTVIDDVLAIEPDGFLVCYTNRGTVRASGGAYVRQFLMLWTLGSDGLATRNEFFDVDRAAEALARFGELTAKPERPRRRVRPNAMTAWEARLEAAIAAHDPQALGAIIADPYEETIDHIGGCTYDRRGALANFTRLIAVPGFTFRQEPLATLGESLGLTRVSISSPGGAFDGLDVGPWENEVVALGEADAQGRQRRSELFPASQLATAIVRMYERYAELVPDGPARARAATAARSLATLLAMDLTRLATAFDPALEFVDARPFGFPPLRGADRYVELIRSLVELSTDIVHRIDDVLALEANGLAVRWTQSGTALASGGAYERQFLLIMVFGQNGLATNLELFATDRETEALARFEELVGTPPKPPRRMHANAATVHAARLDAAAAARDMAAIGALFVDDTEAVDHTTGATYGRRAGGATFDLFMRSHDPRWRQEPLATLGDSLALLRQSISGSGVRYQDVDVGAYEMERIVLREVDASGLGRRLEVFASDRLGDALARLYERYAELLPDGPARARAMTTARAIPTLHTPADADGMAATITPTIESVDHRILGTWTASGADAVLRNVRSLAELVEGFGASVHDVLDLRPDAVLVRMTFSGTSKVGGGAFERACILLRVFGPDGRQTRIEYFDADREAEALARFDALTGAQRPARIVRPNAATANAARVDAAVAARDLDGLAALIADDAHAMEHPTDVVYDRTGMLFSYRSLINADDPAHRTEILASLGDSLALCRVTMSASRFAGRNLDVGAYERVDVRLVEADTRGRIRLYEAFAEDRLGDAVARLYERYAELLPEGPARARAAATARSFAASCGPFDPDRYAGQYAPDVESVDHRILGTMSAQGAESLLAHLRAWFDLIDAATVRDDDVLALEADAVLVRRTLSGIDRAGGGAFERLNLQLMVFGNDGLITRIEWFDADCDAEALARFRELTASRGAAKPRRRVRPNAATAHLARLDAAAAARDFAGLEREIGESWEFVDHANGVAYDRRGRLTSMRSIVSVPGSSLRHEPLGTLGTALALCRFSMSAPGVARGSFDVGAYEMERILVIEADGEGRGRRGEGFASDRLSAAIARVYERYAELLPEGPARERAAATARSVAAYGGRFDLVRFATALHPAIEVIDHRTLATYSARGAEAYLEHFRGWLELANDTTTRDDDLLGLHPDALLVLRTFYGTGRATGGAFERQFIMLWVFGHDGLVVRCEYFDTDRGAEALARFDELTADRGPRRVTANAATAQAARTDAALAARDVDALPDLLADDLEVVDHPTGVTYDKQGRLATQHAFLRAREPTCRNIPLATLGESLALCRWPMAASGFTGRTFDVGAFEREELALIEVDAKGRCRRCELFATDRLGDALARLYERYAELLPEGAARARATKTARAVGVKVTTGTLDVAEFAATIAPTIEAVDHRVLGMWSASGAEAVLRDMRSLFDMSEGMTLRVDAVLDARPAALLVHHTSSGTSHLGGGIYEFTFLLLRTFGPDGLQTRFELFDADREADALARFDALMAESVSPIANTAVRMSARFIDAWAARDWETLAVAFAPGFRLVDRRSYAHLELDRDQHLASLRFRFDMRLSRQTVELLATRGDRLELSRSRFELADGDVGPSETESLGISEVDEQGKRVALVMLDADALDAAYAELDARYFAGEAAAHPRVAAGVGAFVRGIEARDWDAVRALFSADLVVQDHRPLGWETLHGPELYVKTLESLVELAPDVRLRQDHVSVSDRAALFVDAWVGTRDGGAFEAPRAVVFGFDAGGRMHSMDLYNVDQLDAARARFEEPGTETAASSDPERCLRTRSAPSS